MTCNVMITIRTYRDSDFKELAALLIRSHNMDSLTDELIREKLYADPDWNPESALVAEADESIAGFMMGVIRTIKGTVYGYVKLMTVDVRQRRKGLATALYSKLEQHFLENNVQFVRIYDVPLNYFVPGVDPGYTEAVCFALKRGFTRNGKAVNMTVNLNWSDWDSTEQETVLREKHIEFRRATPNDFKPLISFISSEWALWGHELGMGMKNEPVSIFLALRDNKILAFAAYDCNNKGTGWFGPMGTDPLMRGHNLGRILLYKCLAELRGQERKTAIIPWVAPIGFYAHHANARISRTFWRFQKHIQD